MRKSGIVAIALIGAVGLTGCSTVSTDPTEVALHYGNGPFEGKEFKACVPSGDRQNLNSFGDNYFHYPASQRTYDYTGGQNSDRAPFEVVSKDNQIMTIPGALEFSLNTNCGTDPESAKDSPLNSFHVTVGSRYQAYNTEPGQPSNEGWAKVLDLYIGASLDAALDRVAKQYNWKDMYSNPAIKDEINAKVNETLATIVNQKFQGDHEFFINFSSLALQPEADAELIAALKQEEASKAQASATQVKAEADAAAAEASANAQVKVKQAELTVAKLNSDIELEKIRPFGDVKNYLDYLAVQKGINPFQPTYLVGGVTK
jgi:regulator of protease activity HflC (stomatin/prohibitin superfamily)